MQQAYLELLTGKALFDERSTLKTFVFAVVQNPARSRHRRKARHLRLVAEHAAESAATSNLEVPVERSSLRHAVTALPPRQRDIVELAFLRDMTVEQASTVMGVTVGTGWVHYDRANPDISPISRFLACPVRSNCCPRIPRIGEISGLSLAGSVASVAAVAAALLMPARQEPWQPEPFEIAGLPDSTSWAAPSDLLLPEHEFDIFEELPGPMESTDSAGGALL